MSSKFVRQLQAPSQWQAQVPSPQVPSPLDLPLIAAWKAPESEVNWWRFIPSMSGCAAIIIM